MIESNPQRVEWRAQRDKENRRQLFLPSVIVQSNCVEQGAIFSTVKN